MNGGWTHNYRRFIPFYLRARHAVDRLTYASPSFGGFTPNSLFIYVNELHVHRVNSGENIGSSLYDAFARLRHGDGRAGRDKDRLVATAQRQIRQIVALYKDDLLIAEAHLSSRIPVKEISQLFESVDFA